MKYSKFLNIVDEILNQYNEGAIFASEAFNAIMHNASKVTEKPVTCPNCGATLQSEEDITSIEVARQTHESPAKYSEYCEHCIPIKYQEPDPDRCRD